MDWTDPKTSHILLILHETLFLLTLSFPAIFHTGFRPIVLRILFEISRIIAVTGNNSWAASSSSSSKRFTAQETVNRAYPRVFAVSEFVLHRSFNIIMREWCVFRSYHCKSNCKCNWIHYKQDYRNHNFTRNPKYEMCFAICCCFVSQRILWGHHSNTKTCNRLLVQNLHSISTTQL